MPEQVRHVEGGAESVRHCCNAVGAGSTIGHSGHRAHAVRARGATRLRELRARATRRSSEGDRDPVKWIAAAIQQLYLQRMVGLWPLPVTPTMDGAEPASGSEIAPLEALLPRVRLAARLPPVVGAKRIESEQLAFAASVVPQVLLALKLEAPVPVGASPLKLIGQGPLLVSVIVCAAAAVPTFVEGKGTLLSRRRNRRPGRQLSILESIQSRTAGIRVRGKTTAGWAAGNRAPEQL
jgi:hypothetical protein